MKTYLQRSLEKPRQLVAPPQINWHRAGSHRSCAAELSPTKFLFSTMMIASMPRGRAFILAFLISIGVLSYWSFDSHIRPAFTTFYPTTPAKSVAIPTADASEILLVSAFYPLPKSKHSMSDYSSWLSRFLQPITTPIYFFTTPDMEPTIRRLRGNLPITINTTYASPFDIPPLAGRRAEYEEMWRHDREKDRHNPDLYAIWTAKPFFLDEGMKNAKGAYKHAFWTDAGSFRQSHQFTAWPDAQRVKEVWEEGSMESGTNPDDLFFIPMWYPPHDTMQYWMEGMGPIDNEFSEGTSPCPPFPFIDSLVFQARSSAALHRPSAGGVTSTTHITMHIFPVISLLEKTRHSSTHSSC